MRCAKRSIGERALEALLWYDGDLAFLFCEGAVEATDETTAYVIPIPLPSLSHSLSGHVCA